MSIVELINDYHRRTLSLTAATTSANIRVYISGMLDYCHPEVTLSTINLLHTGIGQNIDIGMIGSPQEFRHEPE
jgi:hypothetical protein